MLIIRDYNWKQFTRSHLYNLTFYRNFYRIIYFYRNFSGIYVCLCTFEIFSCQNHVNREKKKERTVKRRIDEIQLISENELNNLFG